MAEKTQDKKKERIPSARKRALQNEQRRLRNRSHRASLLTAVRDFEGSLSKKDASEALKEKLSVVYRLMDKGVKKGVYTINKAARTKSRLHARMKTV